MKTSDSPRAKLPKEYVDVKVDFDKNGIMTPREIIWTDGSRFRIDRIKNYRLNSELISGFLYETYTIMIGCHETKLYFERVGNVKNNYIGKWFVYRI